MSKDQNATCQFQEQFPKGFEIGSLEHKSQDWLFMSKGF
jgi:hypothetical protein